MGGGGGLNVPKGEEGAWEPRAACRAGGAAAAVRWRTVVRVAFSEVWSPAGGFYADPKKWKRNTLITAAAMASIAYFAFQQSTKMEDRHARPHSAIISEQFYTEKNFPQQQQ